MAADAESIAGRSSVVSCILSPVARDLGSGEGKVKKRLALVSLFLCLSCSSGTIDESRAVTFFDFNTRVCPDYYATPCDPFTPASAAIDTSRLRSTIVEPQSRTVVYISPELRTWFSRSGSTAESSYQQVSPEPCTGSACALVFVLDDVYRLSAERLSDLKNGPLPNMLYWPSIWEPPYPRGVAVAPGRSETADKRLVIVALGSSLGMIGYAELRERHLGPVVYYVLASQVASGRSSFSEVVETASLGTSYPCSVVCQDETEDARVRRRLRRRNRM